MFRTLFAQPGRLLGAASPAKAVGVSSAVHTAGLLVMASLVAPSAPDVPQFSGKSRLTTIEIQWAASPASPSVVLPPTLADEPVVITPREAQLVRRRVRDVPAFRLPAEPIEQVLADALSDGDIPPHPALLPARRPPNTSLHPVPAPPEVAAVQVPRRTLTDPMLSAGTDEEERPDFSANRPPPYPLLARQRGWEGTVLLRVHVAANGQVSQVEVARSSGYAVLDAAAVGAVRGWRGQPARRGGVAMSTIELLPVRFQLR